METPTYVLAFDSSCLCLTGSVNVKLNGGTGKYEDAAGSADFVVSQDPTTLVVTKSFDGLISY